MSFLTPFGTENYFYEEQVRRSVVAFGVLFSDMYVKRAEKWIKLPLKFGGGYLYEKLPQDSETRENTKKREILPSMAFSMSEIDKDTTRLTQQFADISFAVRGVDNMSSVISHRVPYNIQFTLYTRTKYTAEDLQILEQITGVFAPSVTVSMDPLASTKDTRLKQESTIVLDSIGLTADDLDDGETDKKIEREYRFTFKTYLYARPKKTFIIDEILIRSVMDESPMEQTFIRDLEALDTEKALAELDMTIQQDLVDDKPPRKTRLDE